ncbi:MAG: acyltransferase family protein [Sediminicola sp.]
MRRYDMDWLRVIVFALLIFYHIGMFFVPWGFHIKNNVVYQWLVYPMLFLNQWRLPILFVISGMGTYYALQRRSMFQFSLERLKRLLLPLIFGILVVVPPQVYLERLTKGEFSGNYFSYWPAQAFVGIYPTGNFSWHHLWFLPYLLLFSLVLIPIFRYVLLKAHSGNKGIWGRLVAHPLGIFVFVVPLYFTEAFMEPRFPITHALVGDWFTLVNFGILFLYGFLLISVKQVFWTTVEKYRRLFLAFGIIGFTLFLVIVFGFEDTTLVHYTEAFVKVFNLWSWILAIFGYASKYLNKPSNILRYCNEAVYPFYILHQSVMMVSCYYLRDLPWSLFTKFMVMVPFTFLGSWAIYELLIRRWKWVRPLFGLKPKTHIRATKETV